jgi:transitional endoplasmic reticulum ATPase
MGDLKFLLEKTIEHLEAAGKHRQARNYPSARCNYLKAAEYLLKAASQSTGQLRQLRQEKAEQLLALAHRLEGSAQREKASAPPIPAVQDQPSSGFLLREIPQVRLDDVAGLEDVKQEIRLRMIYPLEYPEKAHRYGIRRGGGLLLYGPPGTGKTLLARAVAGEIQAPFFTAKPSELMSKWVGDAEKNVAQLFQEARQHQRAVIFLDEVEALIPARRRSDSTVMQRVVPQILAEMDGLQKRSEGLLFMAATNEPWAIDRAALRPGRFHTKIYVRLPDLPARRRMLDLYLAHRPLAEDVHLDRLAEALEGYSGADIANLCEQAAAHVFLEAIQKGIDRPIQWEDLQKVLATTRPSVPPEELQRYHRWAQEN